MTHETTKRLRKAKNYRNPEIKPRLAELLVDLPDVLGRLK